MCFKRLHKQADTNIPPGRKACEALHSRTAPANGRPHPRFGRRKLMPEKPASKAGVLFCPFCLTRRPFPQAPSASPLWPTETYAGKARLKSGRPFLPVLSHTPSVSAGAVRIPALAGGNLCRESPPQTRASFFARFVSHAVRFRKCCPHPRFGQRMILVHRINQLLGNNMSIYFGGGYVFVPQQFLHAAQIHAAV